MTTSNERQPWRHTRGFGACALTVIAIGTGCGPASNSTPPVDAGPPVVVVPTTPTVDPAEPPPRPSAASNEAPRGDVWLVVKTLRLGITDRATGALDTNAWKTYGFDLDGLDTTLQASESNSDTACKKLVGVGASVLLDGEHGIDNNFGSQLMTVVRSLTSDAEDVANAHVASGAESLLLHLAGVGPQNDPHVAGALYRVADFDLSAPPGAMPRFDGTDVWPVAASSLADGKTIDDPIAHFDDGYVANGVWVSGDAAQPTDFVLSLPMFGDAPFAVKLSFVQIAVGIDGSGGTLAGVAGVDDLRAAVGVAVEEFGVCSTASNFESVVSTFTDGLDLSLTGAGFRDPTAICDAMSLAIGFDAVGAQPPTNVVVEPPSASVCVSTSATTRAAPKLRAR